MFVYGPERILFMEHLIVVLEAIARFCLKDDFQWILLTAHVTL